MSTVQAPTLLFRRGHGQRAHNIEVTFNDAERQMLDELADLFNGRGPSGRPIAARTIRNILLDTARRNGIVPQQRLDGTETLEGADEQAA